MKTLALVLAFCALLAGTGINLAEARQAPHIQNINHRYNGGFQLGFGNRGFYFGYGQDYGYRNFGYRNYGYRGYGYGAYGGGLTYGYGYEYPHYAPYTNYYYYAPRYFNPYRGGRHWRY